MEPMKPFFEKFGKLSICSRARVLMELNTINYQLLEQRAIHPDQNRIIDNSDQNRVIDNPNQVQITGITNTVEQVRVIDNPDQARGIENLS